MEENKKHGYLIQWLTGAGDLIGLNLLFFAACRAWGQDYAPNITGHPREAALLLILCYLVSLYFVPVRVCLAAVSVGRIVRRSFLLAAVLAVLSGLCLLFLNIRDVPVVFLVVFYAAAGLFFFLWRVLARLLLRMCRRKGYDLRKAVIVGGTGRNGRKLYGMMKDGLSSGYDLLGFFDDNVSPDSAPPDYIGRTDEVESFAGRHEVDEIYCDLPDTEEEKIVRLLDFAEKHMIRFYIVPEFFRNMRRGFVMETRNPVPLLAVRREPLQAACNRALKRLFDVLFSLIVLLTVFPVMYVLIGILIKISSPGPVLFKQKRTGLRGHTFECYKFRTMRVNSEADELQATEGDLRKTRMGDFLRRTNLDEFPQFFNVLRGDMSVVGPRPHMLKHTEQYSALIDNYMVRHIVKPGVTGWAQVTGYRGETKTLEQMEGRVERDVWYIENWSFFLDLKIIVMTVLNMFKGDNQAY